MTEFEMRRHAVAWWKGLQPDPDRPRPQDRGGDRGSLARLRRAATPLEAAEQAAAVALARALAVGVGGFENAAVCAGVLAHVRQDDPGVLVAARIGVNPSESNARPLVSPLRFRRLIEARDAGERLTQFRRLVALAGSRLNVGDLAVAVLDWSDKRRRDWIFRYHAGDVPAAASPASTTLASLAGDQP